MTGEQEQMLVRWPSGPVVGKGVRKAGTGEKQSIKAARESEESIEDN